MSSTDGFSDLFYSSPDGLKLHARIYGETNSGPWPVVCLPGLTRNARDFHELAIHLSQRAETRARSSPSTIAAAAGRHMTPNRQLQCRRRGRRHPRRAGGARDRGAAFIGTSRGGLIIHVLGAMRPAVLKAIVLNDIGPVIEAEGPRPYPRLSRPGAEAEDPGRGDRCAARRARRGFSGADRGGLGADGVGALSRDGQGLAAGFRPAAGRDVAGLDLSKPLPDLWPQFEALAAIPLLAIRGANSKLLSVETLEEMRKRHPGMEAITVEGQGHAPFLETGNLPGAIAAFLDEAENAARIKVNPKIKSDLGVVLSVYGRPELLGFRAFPGRLGRLRCGRFALFSRAAALKAWSAEMRRPSFRRTAPLAARRFQHDDAAVEIVGGQMRVAHGHRKRLVAEPHLHAPDVDAALDKTRRAGVAQDVRHHLVVGAEADFGFRIVPDGAKLRLAEFGERTLGPAAL